ncbi:uncharacterized protein M437DRAFT_50344 [Aureobasidium melanogenum CBS 110374]|uniref:AMP-activated protein kinase glycogen-binding domain-containing protein n=1 Tax=Aureobasidium melanogenum (strain CBS 110374) TaxID=1043003 RepID=A0A074VNL6_AURM1|nr:uncharacterized protein M437DRAFT_50344 [Aureobasidium melanogenum CBS 110374]KEQ62310.1 hypothetical protein M437DRAFT_50344 [Aureobasidium melanogenum CBS 110374]
MGQYTFTWNHPAQEVYVTGDFDNWSKSVKLDKHGDSFRKTITLPGEESRIHYKFVVDGNWTTDSTAKQETDASGNVNNVVEARELSPEPEDRPANAFISSAHPQSTTAALAGQVPLEKERNVPSEQNETSLPQETPGFEDLPGQFPITPMADLNQFTVNPIPATAGIGNPIKLPAGEPVPHPSTITSNTVQSTVRDGSQYGVSDTGAPVLPPVLDSQSEAEANGASMFNLPPIGGTMIPESSLPMGAGNDRLPNLENAFTSSVAPQSTTAQLAGQVPLEPRGALPDVVTESQERAHAEPEASASPEVVREKAAFEDELKHSVPEAPATSESGLLGTGEGGLAAKIAAGTAAVGTAAAGLAYAARDKAIDAHENAGAPLSNLTKEPTIDGSVPEVVTESQERAHADPEASASPEVVREKTAMEGELLSEVHKAPATSESGLESGSEQVPEVVQESQEKAHVEPEASANPEAVHEKHDMESELLSQVNQAPATSESDLNTTDKSTSLQSGSEQVPEVVHESQERAHVGPEASANAEAVHEKSDMEKELLANVHKAPATSESGVLGSSEQGVTGRAAAGLDSSSDVPEVVHESQDRAHVAPEASANSEAVHEKSDMEKELLSQVHKAPATSESAVLAAGGSGATGVTAVSGVPPVDAPPITSANARSTGLNAPAESQAQIPAPGESENLAATLAAPAEPSRDVSPMTRPDSSKQTEPQVTTGTETHNVPATSGSTPTTPQRNATKRSSQFGSLRGTPKSDRTSIAGSSKVDEDGKPKKKGFLAKLKEKFRG